MEQKDEKIKISLPECFMHSNHFKLNKNTIDKLSNIPLMTLTGINSSILDTRLDQQSKCKINFVYESKQAYVKSGYMNLY